MHDFVITWTRYDDKFTCNIGHLTYNEETNDWKFIYDQEGINVAYQLGFRGFAEFPNYEQEYTSPKLFDQFSSRLQRNIINLKTETEKVNLLKQTKGRLNTDKILINEKGRQRFDDTKRR